MTIEQANSYFEALPDGFASTDQLRAALPASAQKVQFVGVAGTAGKTTVAALLAATLRAAGIHAGLYHAGCEPLSVRVRVDGAPVDEGLLCLAAEAQAAAEPLPQSWQRPPMPLARPAVHWLWWSCRTPVWQRLCPRCRCAPSPLWAPTA